MRHPKTPVSLQNSSTFIIFVLNVAWICNDTHGCSALFFPQWEDSQAECHMEIAAMYHQGRITLRGDLRMTTGRSRSQGRVTGKGRGLCAEAMNQELLQSKKRSLKNLEEPREPCVDHRTFT